MKTECQVVYDNLKSVRRLVNIPFMDLQNKHNEWKSVNVSYVEVERIDDALRLLKKQIPVPVKIHDDKWVSDNRHLITCPICEEWLDYEDWMFCPKCGQAVKWE